MIFQIESVQAWTTSWTHWCPLKWLCPLGQTSLCKSLNISMSYSGLLLYFWSSSCSTWLWSLLAWLFMLEWLYLLIGKMEEILQKLHCRSDTLFSIFFVIYMDLWLPGFLRICNRHTGYNILSFFDVFLGWCFF